MEEKPPRPEQKARQCGSSADGPGVSMWTCLGMPVIVVGGSARVCLVAVSSLMRKLSRMRIVWFVCCRSWTRHDVLG